jgi:hypothetical protein
MSVAALAATGLAAGQAVGPVLAGSVTGSAGLTVEQAITLDTSGLLGSNPLVNSDTGMPENVTTRNDDGIEFTINVEFSVGKQLEVSFNLMNSSDADAAMVLLLNVPTGIDAEFDEDDSTGDGGQLSRNSYLLVVDSGTDDFTLAHAGL